MKTLILFLLFALAFMIYPQQPWKGSAILGNGNLCFVYSDDTRITALTGNKGIQHFYYKDYTHDYITSSYPMGNGDTNKRTGMEEFFNTLTSSGNLEIRTFALPEDAAVISISGKEGEKFSYVISLRKNIEGTGITVLKDIKNENGYAIASWDNGISILFAANNNTVIKTADSLLTFSGILPGQPLELLIFPFTDEKSALQLKDSLLKERSLFQKAAVHWNKWLTSGKMPAYNSANPEYLEAYKRTLYSVKAANLNGMVPADITGQFMTNNMPQLYPRDAMMCARVFLLTGHPGEAEKIISFWAKPAVPEKSNGEFYARYDAYCKAVDGGSGARYDEPEWDANGYFITLVNEYHKQTGKWLVDKELLYKLADFLIEHIDKEWGLLFEGGIIEWSGFLPSTNMTCSAALKTASEIAEEFGDKEIAAKYKNAHEILSKNLQKTFDGERKVYADIRFKGAKGEGSISPSEITKDTLYLWDSSMLFGVLWGFPVLDELKASVNFYEGYTNKLGGGMQYFESPDKGLAGYGNDVFFFCTAAFAQYQAKYGSKEKAKEHIDWMIKNSNTYGLMPERIYLNNSDCSPASPLSWCNAEFAASILEYCNK